MDAHDRLMQRVEKEQDDVLGTLQLVQGDHMLETHLFEQLVDLLVETMFLELRQRYFEGSLSRDDYVAEMAALAGQCRRVGLLPLSTRDA